MSETNPMGGTMRDGSAAPPAAARHAAEQKARSDRARPLWVSIIVGFLGLSVVANVILMIKATTDPSFVVEPDYYQKAMRFDQTMAQQQESAALGWRIAMEARPPAQPGGAVEVVAAVFDRTEQRIDDATVRVEALHNARSSERFETAMQRGEDGSYHASLPLKRPGLWQFSYVVTRGEHTFHADVRRDVATGFRVAK